jgi:hypothetical protein
MRHPGIAFDLNLDAGAGEFLPIKLSVIPARIALGGTDVRRR